MHLRSRQGVIQTPTAHPSSVLLPSPRLRNSTRSQCKGAARIKFSPPQRLADKQNKKGQKMNQGDRRIEVTTNLAY